MKVGVLICVLMMVGSTTQDAVVQTGAFAEARRQGDPAGLEFFMFSTSYGNYVVRHDGLGEVGTARRNLQFLLKSGMSGRVERMYFLEYQGDLLLSFEVGKIGYVRRMNQQSRKMRWLTPIDRSVVNECVVEENEMHCGDGADSTKIDLKTGHIKEMDQADFGLASSRPHFTDWRISFFNVGT
jgi:hypothetical protein